MTIGWGHLIKDGEHYEKITEEEGEALFLQDVAVVEDAVRDMVKVPLSQNQFDALVVWTYNFDPAKIRRSGTIKRLNAGDYGAVERGIPLWNKGNRGGKLVVLPGLVTRRAREVKLWRGELSLEDIPKPRVR